MRLFTLACAAALVGTCWAQSFTIRTPKSGETIRETYDLRIPSRGIPENAYISIFVNGRFVEATRPPMVGNDFVYKLNTVDLKLPDGPATIEAVLYVDAGETRPAQVLGRSTTNVVIDNATSITKNANGFFLNYKYPVGRELTYAIKAQTAVSQISQAQALLGSRGLEIPSEEESFRYMLAYDNAYSDGSGMVRLMPLPDKGKDHAFIRLSNGELTKVAASAMSPVYMRLSSKGREIFGTQVPYFGLDGLNGKTQRFDVFLRIPTPILPEKRVAPGDIWQGAFRMPNSDIGYGKSKTSDLVPARGQFEAVEYRNGVACAKIKTSIATGAANLRNLNNLGFNSGQNQSLKLESTIWVSIKSGLMIRQELELAQEALINVVVPSASGAATGAGAGRNGAAPPGVRRRGRQSAGFMTPALQPKITEAGDLELFNFQQGLPPSGAPPGFQPQGGGIPPSANMGGGGVPGAAAAPAGVTTKQILRVSMRLTIELER